METLGPLLEQEGYTVHYASEKVSPILRILDMLLSILRLHKKLQIVMIDVYSTSAFYYAYYAAILCRFIGLPYVAILRGGNLPDRIKHSKKKCDSIFRRSHGNVVLSVYMQQAMQQAGYNVELIPNSVTLSNYKQRQIDKVQGAILWVRSFHKIYNPQMAVRMVDMLTKKNKVIHLTMVGPDKDGTFAECQLLARELNITDKITFTGILAKEEWVKLAGDHDIFINTAEIDNMPISVIEAMALGLPVVSTNVGGIPSIINDTQNGLLVDKDDTIAMSNAVEYLMLNEAVVSELSKHARLTAQNFDWSMVKHKWLKLLNAVNV